MAQEVPAAEPEAASGRLRRVLVGERIIALCELHFAQTGELDASSVEELRAGLVEEGGRRSLLARRSPLNRRVFPARPEGRRRSSGRRATDID